MKTLAKSKFKAKMLEIMREIEATGEEIVVTDHGRPCIVIGPYVPKRDASKRDVREVFDDMDGRLILHEDPDLPTLNEWNDT
ncbi:MAG: type II toxin-antitoxin system prevent-host-death family antitoxin [Spirochaeta sp.]|jgi:prevent-host-death family protein|nr:type II toxin-antitoxin system prevent-host-death family antitoxin [Spirochaeta sp.]